MGAEGNHSNWCLRRFDPCHCHPREAGAQNGYGSVMELATEVERSQRESVNGLA